MEVRNLMYLIPILRHIGKLYRKAHENQQKSDTEVVKDYLNDITPILSKTLDNESISYISQCMIRDNQNNSDKIGDGIKILEKAAEVNYGNNKEDVIFCTDADKLASIASGIGQKTPNKYFFKPSRITLTKSSFPDKDIRTNDSTEFVNLYNNLKDALLRVDFSSVISLSYTLYTILYEFTALCPSFSDKCRDISLFDFAKIESALSLSLFDIRKSGETCNDQFLLIGGDFSGIQKYIYQIVSKGAGKSLKGRSFYLKILSDSIVRYILDKLSLYQSNVIYNSGGSFYILAPNTKKNQDIIEESKREIEQRLFSTFNISLYCAIDAIPLSDKELMNTDGRSLKDTWSQLFLKRDALKNKRYSGMMQTTYDSFFSPLANGGEPLCDAITGEEISRTEQAKDFETGNKYTKGAKSLCVKELTYKQKELGRHLRSCDYVLLSRSKLDEGFCIRPLNFDYYYYFLSEREFRKAIIKDNTVLFNLNLEVHKKDDPAVLYGSKINYGSMLIGGSDFPKDKEGYIKTFDELCAGEANSFKRLGVLRMDVDNLGTIFQKGISEENCSLTRYSALSRTLDWFFSGYLNTLWEEIAPDTTYIVYSGGDDLFLIGEWNDIILLAERIREEFKVYTCLNPVFSLSGGIAVVPGKFPIMKGADQSDDEEKRAKKYCNGELKNTKNAISFFQLPMCWDTEYPVVKEIKEQICHVLQNGDLQKSFISKVHHFHEMAKFKCKASQHYAPSNLRIYWLIAYDFGRFKQRCKNDSDAKNLIELFEKDIVQNTINRCSVNTRYHALQLWYFAARWAELEIRSNN